MVGEPRIDAEGRPDPTVLLLLSLYLTLLAFFIVLNASAQHHAEKAVAAVDSLSRHFADGVPERQIGMADEPGSTGGNIRPIATLTALVERTLPLARYTILDGGGAMRLVVPADQLFAPGRADLIPSGAELIAGLTPLLAERAGGQKLEVEFIHPMPVVLNDALAAGEALAVARAGAFARRLVDGGAPADSIATGIRTSDGSAVQLWFNERSEARSRFDPSRSAKLSPP